MAESAELYRYWAFLSYSSKDKVIAKKLHRRLEGYRIPRDLQGRPGRDGPVPKKLFPIFRDREELPLASELGSSIEGALRSSRYLIVLCSPEAARSRWVNEEVRYFKSLGREDRIFAIILAGEPNASDEPTTVPNECFPPALRRRIDEHGQITTDHTEPIAGDLRAGGDGWTSVFLKSVAGITGLGYDAFARREQKRRFRRRMLASAATAVLAVASLWAWDYTRLKVTEYDDVFERWGIPEGVGRFGARPPGGRTFHYRFESRRNKVRRVLRLNRLGQISDYQDDEQTAIQELFYREDGTLQQLDQRQHNGKLVKRNTYSELRDVSEGKLQYVEFRQDHQDAPLASRANGGAFEVGSAANESSRPEITVHQVVYDALGRLGTTTFLNGYRQKRANADGIYGQRYSYHGDSSIPWRIENLGFDGSPAPTKYGLMRVDTSVSASLNIREERFFGINGQPMLNENGFHIQRQTYDEKRDSVDETYFDVDGKPVLRREGYHKVTHTFASGGRTVDEMYSVDGKPVMAKDGYHRTVAVFDGRGNVSEITFYGVDGKPVFNSAGYYRVTQVFDNRENPVETAYFGTHNEPVFNVEGAHLIKMAFDDRGNSVDVAYFGLDGEPVLRDLGYHRSTSVFDESGNLIEQAFFDVMNRPGTATADAINHLKQKFDERGNVVEWSYFAETRPMNGVMSGYHRATISFDQRGSATDYRLFGADGNPVLSRRYGVHHSQLTYDERGRLNGQKYFGVRGEPVMNSDGYHRAAQVFDDSGGLIDESFFGVRGEPVLNAAGYHRSKQTFDARGNVIAFSYFGAGDQPIMLKEEYHRVAQEFDQSGNLIEAAFFNVDGKPILNQAGIHKIIRSFDERDYVIKEAYFGVQDEPILNKDGYASLARSLGARGEELSVEYYGTRAEPVSIRAGYHRIAKSYNQRGSETEESYFGNHDEPVLRREGFHRAVFMLNRYEGVERTSYYDAGGKQILLKDGSRLLANLFEVFNFVLGPNDALALVIPVILPKGDLVLYVDKSYLSFAADGKILADLRYENPEVYRRLIKSDKAGIVEYPPGIDLPTGITKVMTVRRGRPPGLQQPSN